MRISMLAALAALAIALGLAAPAVAGGRHCVGAEEASARVAADGDEDEGVPPTFSRSFYAHTFTLDTSLDGLDGAQLPMSIEQVCGVPKALTRQAARLAGADGIALISAATTVWVDRTPLQGQAALAALDGADTALVRVRLAPQRRWGADEDGDKVPTFTARRITITD
jgi:hypothetical protein